MLKAVQAIASDDYKAYVYLSDDTIRLFDCKKLIENGGDFERLKDESFFRERINVIGGKLSWDLSGEFNPDECISAEVGEILDSPQTDDPLDMYSNEDGNVYLSYMPEVKKVLPAENFEVYAYFTDGSIKLFDCKPILDNAAEGSVFYPLKDEKYFYETLDCLNGTVAWDVAGNHNAAKCVDIDPFLVYDSPWALDPTE